MRNLILFFIKNKEHFVYVLALNFSILLLFNNDNDEMSVIRGFSSDVISLLSTPMVKIKSSLDQSSQLAILVISQIQLMVLLPLLNLNMQLGR